MADTGTGAPDRAAADAGRRAGGPSSGRGRSPVSWTRNPWPSVAVSVVALGSLVFLVLAGVDAGIGLVALVVVAILPWMAAVLEAVDVPGVGSFRFRDVEQRVESQERTLESQERTLESQERTLEKQQEILTKLVVYSMAWYLFRLLKELHHRKRDGGEYLFRDDEATRRDLRFLRDHGYLEHFVIGELVEGQDLVQAVALTPLGDLLVDMREQAERDQAAGRLP